MKGESDCWKTFSWIFCEFFCAPLSFCLLACNYSSFFTNYVSKPFFVFALFHIQIVSFIKYELTIGSVVLFMVIVYAKSFLLSGFMFLLCLLDSQLPRRQRLPPQNMAIFVNAADVTGSQL